MADLSSRYSVFLQRMSGWSVRYRSRWTIWLWSRGRTNSDLKLIDKLYSKEIVLDTIKKWNITGGGSFTDNEDIANHGLSIYFGSRQSTLFQLYEKRYEIARMENISWMNPWRFWYLESCYELFSDQKAQGRGRHQRCRPREMHEAS